MRNLKSLVPMAVCLLAIAPFAAGKPSTVKSVPSAEPPPVQAAGVPDPSLRADIIKLMELTGSAELGKEMASMVADAALESFKSMHPELPTRAYLVAHDVLQSEYGRGFSDPEGFLATVIPIYEKHFNHDEIRTLIAFYDSEVGRKNVALIPTLVQEYEELGKQWAVDMTPAVQQALKDRLQFEGYVLN
jgi:hypothetical protein